MWPQARVGSVGGGTREPLECIHDLDEYRRLFAGTKVGSRRTITRIPIVVVYHFEAQADTHAPTGGPILGPVNVIAEAFLIVAFLDPCQTVERETDGGQVARRIFRGVRALAGGSAVLHINNHGFFIQLGAIQPRQQDPGRSIGVGGGVIIATRRVLHLEVVSGIGVRGPAREGAAGQHR